MAQSYFQVVAAHREYEHVLSIGAAQIIPRLARRTIQTFEATADA
ncbi:MAG: hypothetical protein NVS2B15_15390 [Pseudarthrobacter sp.]